LDTDLEPNEISSSLLAFSSSWIDVCSPDPRVQEVSKQVLSMEIAFAAFCGLENIFIRGPKLYHNDPITGKEFASSGIVQFARAIQEALNVGHRLQISIILPFSDDPTTEGSQIPTLESRPEHLDSLPEEKTETDALGTWESWNSIREFCKFSSRLTVALEVPKQLPPIYAQSRWFSEPLKALFFSNDTFIPNHYGHPSLHKSVQTYISRVMRLKVAPWIILQDIGPIPGLDDPNELITVADGYIPNEAAASPTLLESFNVKYKPSKKKHDSLAHLNYIRYIQRKQVSRTEAERYGAGYQDYLQIPLQPLTDNLESMTYEVFEKDPVKYNLYEKAIRKALRDWADQKKPTSSMDGKVVVAVAGAGRGPLVTRALRASEAEKVPIEMWALEKNPNAFVLLQRHNHEAWNGQVKLVHSDMRSWKGPWHTIASTASNSKTTNQNNDPPISTPEIAHHSLDILISELLGSFGDNELSPECLDGILHLLSKPHGISIPRSYTAYLTPIAAPKIHADILNRSAYEPTAFESPAVVWLHQIDYLSLQTGSGSSKTPRSTDPADINPDSGSAGLGLSADPNVLAAWEFQHGPQSDTLAPGYKHVSRTVAANNSHNWRFSKLRFRTRHRGVCHGLGGYFESVLYPGVELSTNPNTMDEKSNSMISWFAIFFPLKVCLYFCFYLFTW
jgi:type II protein arginine methyltransferase